eukprot:5503235-Alexandrium_andersonii.AAC.1
MNVVVMSAFLHLSPRYLCADGLLHPGLAPSCSLVAGCVHTNSFARCLLYPLLDQLHLKYGLAAPE